MPSKFGPKSLTLEQRSQRGRIAALTRWSKENPAANAARGQAGLLDKFRREVLADDPTVVEPELTRRAEAKRKLHMSRLAYRSSKARTGDPKPSDLPAAGGDAA